MTPLSAAAKAAEENPPIYLNFKPESEHHEAYEVVLLNGRAAPHVLSRWPGHDECLTEVTRLRGEWRVRKVVEALLMAGPSDLMILNAGRALSSVRRNKPEARLGDQFIAQWEAALLAIVEDEK